MTGIKAHYYDGKTSDRREVLITPEPPSGLRVAGDGIDFVCTLAGVRPSARVGNARRHLYFEGGAQCETADNDGVDLLFAGARGQAAGRLLHRWESRLSYVAGALAITGALLWAGIVYGVPALAKQVAFSLPASTEQAIGRNTLEGLDRVILEPSELAPARQAQVKALFANMTAGIDGAGGYRLELRASKKIGANAFALPSGIVVMTDGLVNLAKNDGELIAVFAHEIGHLRQRHTLRSILQNSATVLIVICVTGDLSSISSLGAVLPAVLVDSHYSRDFEREADDYAYDYLKAHNIPTEYFPDILTRIEEQKGGAHGVPDYLSSHPATEERARRFRAAP